MEYLFCTAVTGHTACARLMVSSVASDNPQWVIFPYFIKSDITPATSSIGTLGSVRC